MTSEALKSGGDETLSSCSACKAVLIVDPLCKNKNKLSLNRIWCIKPWLLHYNIVLDDIGSIKKWWWWNLALKQSAKQTLTLLACTDTTTGLRCVGLLVPSLNRIWFIKPWLLHCNIALDDIGSIKKWQWRNFINQTWLKFGRSDFLTPLAPLRVCQ